MFLLLKPTTLLRPWLCACALLLLAGTGNAQTTATGPAAPSAPTADAEPRWEQLSAAEQQSLQPLASIWSSLSQGHRRKWLAPQRQFWHDIVAGTRLVHYKPAEPTAKSPSN